MVEVQSGMFMVLLSLAVIFMVISNKFGSLYRLVSAIIWIVLFFVMMGYSDIVHTVITTSNATNPEVFTEKHHLIGDGDSTTNDIQNVLGWIFMGIGIFQIIEFFDKSFRSGVKGENE